MKNKHEDIFDSNICKHCNGKGYKTKNIDDYFNVNCFGSFATSNNEKCIFCNGTGKKQTMSFDNKFMKDYR